MALLDFLKRKKEVERIKEKKPAKVSVTKKEVKETEKKPVKFSVEKPAPDKSVSGPRDNHLTGKGFSYDAIKKPHISEKASYLAEKNQYVFEISPDYNKKEIKDAVEGIYGVNVLSVNMIKIPAKKRRLGKTEGFRKAYKKATVKIKDGQKIEIL